MPRKLHDEIKSLTSGVVTTGLEYVKHRKKKQLRGGIIPLVVMGLQTAVMELGSWAMEQDAKKDREEAERLERYNQQVWDRQAKQEQAQANASAARDYAEETNAIQRNWGNDYKNQLQSQLNQAKREEQEYLEQQNLERRAYNSQMAEEEKSMYEGDAQRQNLAAYQRQLATKQQDTARLRNQDLARINQSQQQINSLQKASTQRFNLELQQRLRSATAQQQAQAIQQQQKSRRIVAPKSTAQKVRTRR